MNFDLISDLHLHRYDNNALRGIQPSSDILALLGDICTIHQVASLKPFFDFLSKNWKYVLYVPGNHEFYGGCLKHGVDNLRELLDDLKNIIIMDNEVVYINGIRFIGSTLWSDMNNRDPITMLACKDLINDYNYISKDSVFYLKNINPEDTVDLFDKNVDFIEKMLKLAGGPQVVLTHHAPSYRSVDEKFKGQVSNGAFVSSLEYIISDNPSIRVWAHGHTHAFVDYQVDSCRVIANPYGYKGEIYKDEKQYAPIRVEIS